jgi:hypothetical protein
VWEKSYIQNIDLLYWNVQYLVSMQKDLGLIRVITNSHKNNQQEDG